MSPTLKMGGNEAPKMMGGSVLEGAPYQGGKRRRATKRGGRKGRRSRRRRSSKH